SGNETVPVSAVHEPKDGGSRHGARTDENASKVLYEASDSYLAPIHDDEAQEPACSRREDRKGFDKGRQAPCESLQESPGHVPFLVTCQAIYLSASQP